MKNTLGQRIDFGVETDDDCYVIYWEDPKGSSKFDSLAAYENGRVIVCRSPHDPYHEPKEYNFADLLDNALPSREQVRNAAKVLLKCNGNDLSEWGGDDLLDDFAQDALKALASE